MGGKGQALEPILGREGYLERLTQATFQVRVEEGQVQLLVPDFAYSGFLRPETARIRLYSYQQDLIITLETKRIFSAGILDLTSDLTKATKEVSGTDLLTPELSPDSAVYFKYQIHPGALIALEKVRIGKGTDSEYGFKKIFTNRKDLKEYCSAQNSADEEDFSVLLERAEKAYGGLEEKSEEKDLSKTVPMDSKSTKRKPEFAGIVRNWFQSCLDQNESGKLLTHEEEVELGKQKDKANHLMGYAFSAAQTAMAVYFPEIVSPLFAEAYSVLEAVISSDENGLQNAFSQYFSTRRAKGGYLAPAQEIFPQLEEILALQEEIQRVTASSSSGSLGLELPEEFLAALSGGSAELDSISLLKLKSERAELQPKLSRYQQLLINLPLQDTVREQILAGALSTALELAENRAEQGKGGLAPQEKDNFNLILNCSRAYQRGKDLYEQTIDQFLAKNYRLCFNIARRMSGLKGDDELKLFDYFQEGAMGMKKAAEYFEWERGYKFCTYATWWVRQYINRAVENTTRTVRLPTHVHESMTYIFKTIRHIRSQLHREPTTEEISAATGLPEKKVLHLLNVSRDSLSLESYIGKEDNDTDSMLRTQQSADSELLDGFVHRPLSPLKLAVQNELAEIMDSALTKLTPIGELIIRMRNGLDPFKREYTLDDIGRELARTRERIRQLEGEGLEELKGIESLRSCW